MITLMKDVIAVHCRYIVALALTAFVLLRRGYTTLL